MKKNFLKSFLFVFFVLSFNKFAYSTAAYSYLDTVVNNNLAEAAVYYVSNNNLLVDSHGKLDLSKRGLNDLSILNRISNPLSIKTLDLSNNNIRYINSYSFSRFTNLERLYLNHNQLEDFYKFGGYDIFNGLNRLQTLDLSHNKISYLPQNFFYKLRNLRKLYLSHNLLTEFPTEQGFWSSGTEIFSGLGKLEKLSLSNNYLYKLPKNAFHGLRNLKYLYLNNNNLTEFPVDFVGYTSVFKDLKSLHTLDLSGNKIYNLPTNGFEGLRKLVKLYLNKNNLIELPTDFLGGTKVFSRLYNLESLDLSDNKLNSLPIDGFKDLKRLTSLYLQRNRLGSIPTNFWSGTRLFEALKSLEVLNLSYNDLAYLPYNIFTKLKELRRLYLNNNKLTEITTGFWNDKTVFDDLRKLEKLDISNNYINYVPASILNRFPNMRDLYLDVLEPSASTYANLPF